MVEVVRYNGEYKAVWDAFVKASKSGTFLLLRDYMDYHADRFRDHSLLFYRKNKLVALLPANEQGEELHSHAGLTYGGMITDARMKAGAMLEVFEAMQHYLREQEFRKIKYKTIPHIYHRSPAEEDLYALLKSGAVLTRRDLLSVVMPAQALGYSKKRRWEVAKARAGGWYLGRSYDFKQYMHIVAELLRKKYDAVPVHTPEEIQTLAASFPVNIKLFTATDAEGNMAAGVLIYETDTVAHCQYIGYTEKGRIQGALAVLLDYLLTEVYAAKAYFDLGASMEGRGLELNSKLLANKESYGARAVVQDFYEIKL